jgi:hypothetical protein
MKEYVLSKEGTLSISYKQEALLDPERFKLRMTRFLESIDDLWDEYERLKKYSARQKE